MVSTIGAVAFLLIVVSQLKPQSREKPETQESEIVMQNIEEQAPATYSETLPLWLRYVDDTITAVLESKID